jgi:hypothetical protein
MKLDILDFSTLLELQGVVLYLSEVLFYSKMNVNDYE